MSALFSFCWCSNVAPPYSCRSVFLWFKQNHMFKDCHKLIFTFLHPNLIHTQVEPAEVYSHKFIPLIKFLKAEKSDLLVRTKCWYHSILPSVLNFCLNIHRHSFRVNICVSTHSRKARGWRPLTQVETNTDTGGERRRSQPEREPSAQFTQGSGSVWLKGIRITFIPTGMKER